MKQRVLMYRFNSLDGCVQWMEEQIGAQPPDDNTVVIDSIHSFQVVTLVNNNRWNYAVIMLVNTRDRRQVMAENIDREWCRKFAEEFDARQRKC